MMDNNARLTINLNRKKFLALLASTGLYLVPSFALSNSALRSLMELLSSNPEDIKMQVAIARALTHQPGDLYQKLDDPSAVGFNTRRAAAISLLGNKVFRASEVAFPTGMFSDLVLNVDPVPLYNSLGAEIPKVDLFNAYKKLDKDTVSAIGSLISGVTGLSGALLPGIATPMVLMGTMGTGMGIQSALMKDDKAAAIVNYSSILLAQSLWSDPSAKKIMNAEVKKVLNEAFGVDFGASVEENKKYLSQQAKGLIDVYDQNSALSAEQRNQKEQANVKAITSQVNDSLNSAVGKIIADMKEQQKVEQDKQRDKLYNEGEIRGVIFMANFLADKLLSPRAGKIVSTIANSAFQVSSLLGAIGAGTLGPFGAAAGFMNIAIGLGGLFGKAGISADQIIIESIGKVQESIRSMHVEMWELFGVVIENQQKMMERIDLQFELLRTKQDQAIQQLNKIQTELKTIAKGNRERGRDNQTTQLNREIQGLNSQINKKILGEKVSAEIIENAIRECYLYGIETTKYTDFTGLSREEEGSFEWDPNAIIEKLEGIDQVDYLVGILPSIINRFAPGKSIPYPNNPKGLGCAAIILSVAYFAFPNISILYEKGSMHYLKDFKLAFANTRKALEMAVEKETIDLFKVEYLLIVERIIQNALKFGEDASRRLNHIDKDKSIRISAAGPFAESALQIEGVNVPGVTIDTVTWFSQLPDFAILQKDIFIRDGGEIYLDPRYGGSIGQYKKVSFQKFNPNGSVEVLTDTKLFLEALEKLDIIKIEEGKEISKPISFKGNYSIPDGPVAGNYSFVASAEEKLIPSKITVLQGDSDTPFSFGDGVTTGWIRSKIVNQKSSGNSPLDSHNVEGYKVTQMEDKNIAYLSNDITGEQKIGTFSEFLTKVNETFNSHYKVRKEIINNAISKIADVDNPLSLDLEAAAHCLKYLASIKGYLTLGEAGQATAISKDEVIGVNLFIKSDIDESVSTAKKQTNLLSKRNDLSSLVKTITDYDYLYNSDYRANRADAHLEIKEYISSEILSIAEQTFQEYVDYYFPFKESKMNLPELTLPEMTLAVAELKVKN